jgi:hypothetical protein
MPLQVDQDGAVTPPTAESEVIHAHYSWRHGGGQRGLPHASEQSVGASLHRQLECGAGTGLTAEQKADEFQRFIHAHGLAPVVSDNTRQALAEDTLDAQVVLAAKAARAQEQADRDTMPGQVGHRARVVAVDAS